jgi:Putative Actinobacterial Holin-X, holin superfamily III
MSSPSNRSIPDLVSDAFGQLAKLVGNEFDLARAELADKASQVGRAAALIGAGATILIPALVLLLFAAAAALVESGFSEAVSDLIVGGVAVLVSAALIATGLNRLSGGALKPSVTLDQVQRDKVAVKEMVR